VKDHIDEFIHASMDEHKTCFKEKLERVFVLCCVEIVSFVIWGIV